MSDYEELEKLCWPNYHAYDPLLSTHNQAFSPEPTAYIHHTPEKGLAHKYPETFDPRAISQTSSLSQSNNNTAVRQNSSDSYSSNLTASDVWIDSSNSSPRDTWFSEPEENSEADSPMEILQEEQMSDATRSYQRSEYLDHQQGYRISAVDFNHGKSFQTDEMGQKHGVISKSSNTAKCICGRFYEGAHALNSLRHHIGDIKRKAEHRLFGCNYCEKAYRRSHSLHLHSKLKHSHDDCTHCLTKEARRVKRLARVNNIICSDCGTSFNKLQATNPEGYIVCPSCGKQFKKQDDYNKHIETSHRERSCARLEL